MSKRHPRVTRRERQARRLVEVRFPVPGPTDRIAFPSPPGAPADENVELDVNDLIDAVLRGEAPEDLRGCDPGTQAAALFHRAHPTGTRDELYGGTVSLLLIASQAERSPLDVALMIGEQAERGVRMPGTTSAQDATFKRLAEVARAAGAERT